MVLTILGSAAAEGWPALFCHCDVCREARRLGGKDVRRRTSYRLGDHVQIDWGPDTYAASVALGLDTSALTELVVTHSHEDHLTPHELWYRRPGFSLVPEDAILTIHGSEQVEQALHTHTTDDAYFRLRVNVLEPYREQALPDGLTVTPLPAAHAEGLGGALNFIFRRQGRSLLIGNDTGWWAQEVWDLLAGAGLDLVLMDCTYGARPDRGGHLGAPDVVEVKQELTASGALADNCRFVANHFSHNGGWLHAELEAFLNPHGIEVGYDGMTLTL